MTAVKILEGFACTPPAEVQPGAERTSRESALDFMSLFLSVITEQPESGRITGSMPGMPDGFFDGLQAPDEGGSKDKNGTKPTPDALALAGWLAHTAPTQALDAGNASQGEPKANVPQVSRAWTDLPALQLPINWESQGDTSRLDVLPDENPAQNALIQDASFVTGEELNLPREAEMQKQSLTLSGGAVAFAARLREAIGRDAANLLAESGAGQTGIYSPAQRQRMLMPKINPQAVPEEQIQGAVVQSFGERAEAGDADRIAASIKAGAGAAELQPRARDGGKPERRAAQGEVAGRLTTEKIGAAAVLQHQARRFELAGIQKGVISPTQADMPNSIGVARQLADAIESMRGEMSEFKIRLKPEGLGEVTVKLKSVGERLEVELSAKLHSTRQLIAREIEALQGTLSESASSRFKVVSVMLDGSMAEGAFVGFAGGGYSRGGREYQMWESESEHRAPSKAGGKRQVAAIRGYTGRLIDYVV